MEDLLFSKIAIVTSGPTESKHIISLQLQFESHKISRSPPRSESHYHQTLASSLCNFFFPRGCFNEEKMLDLTLLSSGEMLAFAQSHTLHVFLAFGSALLVASAAYIVYQCYFSPLASFPGPFAAKVTTLWRAYTTSRGQWHRKLGELHRRHGSVVRIGPNQL